MSEVKRVEKALRVELYDQLDHRSKMLSHVEWIDIRALARAAIDALQRDVDMVAEAIFRADVPAEAAEFSWAQFRGHYHRLAEAAVNAMTGGAE